jgi:hypothetical protein
MTMVLVVASAANAQSVDIGDAQGAAGATVAFTATLKGSGGQVVAITQRVDFSPVTHVPANAKGKPDCTFAAALATKKNSSFNYWPAGCDPSGCTRINVTIVDLGTHAKDPIADGALYTCKFLIPSTASAGTKFTLKNSRTQITKPTNQTVDVTARSKSGVVTVPGKAAARPARRKGH